MKNRKMNKKLVAMLSLVGAISYFGSDLEVKRIPAAFTLDKIMKTQDHSRSVTNQTMREPGSVTPIAPTPATTSSPVEINYEGTGHPALPENYEFADHIFAVRTSDYNVLMGGKIRERNGYTFFASEEKPQSANKVVIDQQTKKLYLVSSVLKLENISEDVRNELLSKGIEEHYYSSDLKVMYVQSNQEDLLAAHDELKTYNVSPQLELIRAFHKPI